MRIRIVQRPPSTSIDGLQLDRFEPGQEYEVGSSLASVMLAEGWAEPVADASPAHVLSVEDLALVRDYTPAEIPDPANLIREIYPPYLDRQEFLKITADLPLERRKHTRPLRFPQK